MLYERSVLAWTNALDYSALCRIRISTQWEANAWTWRTKHKHVSSFKIPPQTVDHKALKDIAPLDVISLLDCCHSGLVLTLFVFYFIYLFFPSPHSIESLLLAYIHSKLATPIPARLINPAINTFTPLLSNQSLPLSTRRLSCSSSCALPSDVPTDDCVARLPLSAAVLATVSVWRRRRLSDEPCRSEDASLVPPGREEEGWTRTYT